MRPRSKRPGRHHRNSRRGAAWAAAIFSAVLVAGCSSGQNSPATTGSAAESPSAIARPESAPFTIVAQYSAKSLGLLRPAHLAIGPDGNLYIPDAKQRINVISPQGKVLRRWGSPGKGPGQFHFVRHDTDPEVIGETARVAAADGHVYVADNGNARVQVFTAEGKFLRQFGHYGSGRSEWLFPSDVVVDRDGAIYVYDAKGEVLRRFSTSGTLEWQIRASETTDDDLAGNLHLAGVDSHNRLIAVDDDKAKVVYVDRRGHKVDAFDDAFGAADQGCDVTIDSAGNVYVTSCQEPLDSPHTLKIFDRTHQLIASWDPAPMGWSPRFGPKGEIFTLGEDGSILQLAMNLPAR
jgi:hypothetical protein